MPFVNKNLLDKMAADIESPAEKKDVGAAAEKIEEKIEQADFGVGESEQTVVPEKEGLAGASTLPSAINPDPTTNVKSAQLQQIEAVMQEDLGDLYSQMNERQRLTFKIEGEKSARQIEAILTAGKSVAKKILGILRKWLGLIPGVNKFFIEQEAKIKTDKIIEDNINTVKQ